MNPNSWFWCRADYNSQALKISDCLDVCRFSQQVYATHPALANGVLAGLVGMVGLSEWHMNQQRCVDHLGPMNHIKTLSRIEVCGCIALCIWKGIRR